MHLYSTTSWAVSVDKQWNFACEMSRWVTKKMSEVFRIVLEVMPSQVLKLCRLVAGVFWR